MNIHKPFPIALALLAASATAGSAQSFQYNTSDLLIGLQQPGAAGEVLVDVGAVTTYTTQSPGTTVTVPVSLALLQDAFSGGFNNVRCSAFADVNLNAVASPWGTNYPPATVWTTRPRVNLGLQSAPWAVDFGGSKLGAVRSDIESFGQKAVQFANTPSIAPPQGTDNNASGILLPVGDPVYSYSTFVGPQGNLGGDWWGNIEKSMTAAAPVARLDFYESLPGVTTRYLGYFQFYTNGVMTYTSGTLTIPQPAVTGFVKNGNTSTVTFNPTVNGGAYSLLGTNDARNPLGSWPVMSGSTVPGNGSSRTTAGTSASPTELFIILAQ